MCQFDEKVLKNDAEKSGLFEIVEGWYAAVSVWKSFRIVEGKRSRDLWSVFTKVFAIERRGQCDQNCDRWRPRESRDFVFVNWSMLPAISRKIVKIWAERKSQRFHEIFADPLRSITFLKKFVCACEVKIWAVEPSFSRKKFDLSRSKWGQKSHRSVTIRRDRFHESFAQRGRREVLRVDVEPVWKFGPKRASVFTKVFADLLRSITF